MSKFCYILTVALVVSFQVSMTSLRWPGFGSTFTSFLSNNSLLPATTSCLIRASIWPVRPHPSILLKSLHCKFLHCPCQVETNTSQSSKLGEISCFLFCKKRRVRFARPASPNCSGGCSRKVKVSRGRLQREGRPGAACRPVLWGDGGGWRRRVGGVGGARKSTLLARPTVTGSPGGGEEIHPPIQYFLLLVKQPLPCSCISIKNSAV